MGSHSLNPGLRSETWGTLFLLFGVKDEVAAGWVAF